MDSSEGPVFLLDSRSSDAYPGAHPKINQLQPWAFPQEDYVCSPQAQHSGSCQ